MTDRPLLDVVQTGYGGLLEQDPVHFRVKVLLLQVVEVDVAGLEGDELVVELDVLQVLVEEQAVADSNLAWKRANNRNIRLLVKRALFTLHEAFSFQPQQSLNLTNLPFQRNIQL